MRDLDLVNHDALSQLVDLGLNKFVPRYILNRSGAETVPNIIIEELLAFSQGSLQVANDLRDRGWIISDGDGDSTMCLEIVVCTVDDMTEDVEVIHNSPNFTAELLILKSYRPEPSPRHLSAFGSTKTRKGKDQPR